MADTNRNFDWSIPDKITIVESIGSTVDLPDGGTIPKAYVVFNNDKKALETARNWARYWSNKGTPKEYEVPNDEGFTLQLLMSAGNSSQGGKLAFWNCRIRNATNNIDVSIGINQEVLCTLLLETTFINGLCQSNVVFVRHRSQLGMLAKGTPSYAEAVASQANKVNITIGKTTKWERGVSYETQSLQSVYVGDVYRPFEIDAEYVWRKGAIYTINTTGKPLHMTVNTTLFTEYGLHLQNITSRYTWQWSRAYMSKFPSRKPNTAIKIPDAFLDQVLPKILESDFRDATARPNPSLDELANIAASLDGKITQTMIDEMRKFATSKRTREYYDARNIKHIVEYNGTSTTFSTVKDAVEFIISKITE